MKKIAVIYWSGTGNTEAMANYIAQGAESAGAKADVLTSAQFSADMTAEYDMFIFGCPSMGAEQLEESEFEPMFNTILPSLTGRKIALFGSYGWGNGEWMDTWRAQCESAGANVINCLICHETPSDEDAETCRELGRICAANA